LSSTVNNEGESAIGRLLAASPLGLPEEDKRPLFSAAMAEAFRHHYSNNDVFRTISRKQGITPESFPADLSLLPYLPAALFKNRTLASVPADKITTVLRSSATSGTPSVVSIDRTTARRQSFISAKIMAEYLGHHRRPFLILDAEPRPSADLEIMTRTAAMRGFLVFADSAIFVLEESDGCLRLDEGKLERSLGDLDKSGRDVCVFGFTHLLYSRLIKPLLEKGRTIRLPAGSRLAHIGGWKRLRAENVDSGRFLEDAVRTLGIQEDRIIDFYGFTEQMGVIYAGAGRSPKTVHAYAEIIVRDFDALRPVADGKPGLLQFLTPIFHSHPGISILTEDVGRIVGRGADKSGRWGTRFEILGRAENAEPRGCGDLFPRVGRSGL
jgi:hypothetical protein